MAELTDRLEGLVGGNVQNSKIGIIGVGSVGSFVCEQLVRSGFKNIVLIDNDTVGIENLSRSSFFHENIGMSKVSAMKEVAERINAHVCIDIANATLEHLVVKDQASLLNDCVVLIGCTDDARTQSLINRFSWKNDISSIFIGLYKEAKGGEIAVSLPGLTPCLDCITGNQRKQVASDLGTNTQTNYGTGRLEAQIALGSNIHHVTTSAVRIIIDLLCLQDEGSELGTIISHIISERTCLIVFSMQPEYWIFPALLSDAPGQVTFQSIWMTSSNLQGCDICGSDSCQEDIVLLSPCHKDIQRILNSDNE